MVFVAESDEKNYLLLTEGYLPSEESLESALPRNPKSLRYTPTQLKALLQNESREVVSARLLNSLARRLAYYRRREFSGPLDYSAVPLETWVLGFPTGSKSPFQSWFANEPDNTDYRILIHRQPTPIETSQQQKLPELWRWTHWNAYVKDKSMIRHREITAPLKQVAKGFLQQFLRALQESPQAANEFIRQSGHPYSFVNTGLLNQKDSTQ